MKKILVPVLLLALLLPVACKKTVVHTTKVVRDCTGTYLECAGDHYKVCNIEMLDGYADGDKIKASFKMIDDCQPADGRVECLMAHEYKRWIEVMKIRD